MSSLQKFSRQSQISHSWSSIKLAPPPLACKTRKTAYTGTTSSTRRVTAVRTCPSPMPWWTHRLLPEDTAPDYPKDSITHTFQQVPVPGHVSSRSWPALLNFPAWPRTCLGTVDLASGFRAVANPGYYHQTCSALLAEVPWDCTTCRQGRRLCLPCSPCSHPHLPAHSPLLLPDNISLQLCLELLTPVLQREQKQPGRQATGLNRRPASSKKYNSGMTNAPESSCLK